MERAKAKLLGELKKKRAALHPDITDPAAAKPKVVDLKAIREAGDSKTSGVEIEDEDSDTATADSKG